MYKNIGKKLMGLAGTLFAIEAIVFVGAGIVILFSRSSLIGIGIAAIVLGPFLAWIGSWLLYAFGQMVDDLHELRNAKGNAYESTPIEQSQSKQNISNTSSSKRTHNSESEDKNDKEREAGIEEHSDESLYRKAESLQKQGQYQEAIDIYATILNYRDTKKQIKACQYEYGMLLLQEERYEDAAIAFEMADGYHDSEMQRKEATYQLAMKYIEQKRWHAAANILHGIRSYRDVRQIIADNPPLQNALKNLDHRL